jgi:tricorn protease
MRLQRIVIMLLLVGIGAALPIAPAGAVDTRDTRLLSQPAISTNHIAFAYAGDLWVADLDGGGVRRLTTYPGEETGPHFSPDGRWIAFSGEYDGNTDVFVVPTAGGEPRRLTWHPAVDFAQGFTPDGKSVLFTSERADYSNRYLQLYSVPLAGDMPELIPLPSVYKATYSPDGKHIAYVPLYEVYRVWKNYRGGTTGRILLYDVADHSVEQIPQPAGRCNDTDPMWIGDKIYFLSDRNGEFNLFVHDTVTAELEQLTQHDDFPVLAASSGGGRIIYEQAGYLHIFDLQTRASRRLTVGIASDLLATRPRFVKGDKYIRNAAIAPDGKRAVFEFRGEIVTAPAEKGDPRNITGSPAVHERSPVWSPDGARIAYFSDAGGEYSLHVAPQDGRGEVNVHTLDGAGFYTDPKWSPDGKKISFTDNSWSLYWIDLESGRIRKISSETLYGPIKTLSHNWSPDSRWLVYTHNTRSNFQTVNVYSLAEDRSTLITDGLSDAGEPVFDTSGKYLYFFASTDAGPVRQWFAMSNADMSMTGTLYLAVLQKGTPSPLAKESDEVAVEDEAKKDDEKGAKKGEDEGSAGDKDDDPGPEPVVIDFDGLTDRILSLPVTAGLYTQLQAGDEGQLYYLKSPEGSSIRRFFGGAQQIPLVRFDLKEREEETVLDAAASFLLSADHKKILVSSGDAWSIIDAQGKADTGKGKLATGAIEVRIDPRCEWEQIFAEAWRINRDFFYDPNMHGCDWPAMRQKYAAFLPHLTSRNDLNNVLEWLCSEMAVGHHAAYGGDRLSEPKTVPGGLLGADFDIDRGRYRFAKVYGGLNWNPDLRSPLTEPGVDVTTGEYLLAVDGRDLRPPENLYARFENTSGKIVEITVGHDPGGKDARKVKVVPIENEYALRNRDWVEGNISKVDAATGGRVAYVHVPNTTVLGHTYFKRYFYPQAQKEAIIVDERHNGGGQVADYYLDILRRPQICYWATRYGQDLRTPLAAIHGPKVMLIDETAGSGGDLLPWMFRKLQLGTLVGKTTWGGLVGVLGFPVLMDGGYVTAPNVAIWTEDGYVVENVGVPPDIEVEMLPTEVMQGRDPQLEKAIEVIMQQLPAKPPHKPERPPYPIRVRR